MLRKCWKLWRPFSAMIVRCVVFALAATFLVGGQTQVKQGEVLRITSAGSSAQFLDKTIRLFPQAGSESLGLMPIPVTQAPGKYAVIVRDGHGTKLKDLPI